MQHSMPERIRDLVQEAARPLRDGATDGERAAFLARKAALLDELDDQSGEMPS